jgi:hypothetical protein
VTQNIIDELAPYPKREEDVTAEGLARYLAVQAQVRLGYLLWARGAGEPDPAMQALRTQAYCAEYGLARLLRFYAADHPTNAKVAAREIWRAWQAGDMTGEHLHRWLTEWGIDPDRLRGDDSTKDRGDIAGIPGVVIECKNERAVALAAYADETAAEAANDSAPIGLAWIKRRGKASPASGYVLLDGNTLIRLLADAGYIAKETTDG